MVKSVPGTGGKCSNFVLYSFLLFTFPSSPPHRVLYSPTLNISEDKLERLVIGITDVWYHVLFRAPWIRSLHTEPCSQRQALNWQLSFPFGVPSKHLSS